MANGREGGRANSYIICRSISGYAKLSRASRIGYNGIPEGLLYTSGANDNQPGNGGIAPVYSDRRMTAVHVADTVTNIVQLYRIYT